MNRIRVSCLCLLISFMLVLPCTAAEKLTLKKYHTPQEVSQLLKSWAARYSNLAKIVIIGKSVKKADIVCLRIAARPKGSTDPDTRPGVFISANIEGAHLAGTEAALLLAEKLLTKYGTDKKIKSLLDKRTVYVAPLLNPDVAGAFFAKVLYERRAHMMPVDEDLDTLVDEDGPEDLNKDGLITQIRVKDPEGTWIPDPKEPRLMRKAEAKKGEKGLYKIYAEGIDNDGDGKYNEDPPGGVELNRNFPHDHEYNVKRAGLYPISEKETIALVKFLVSHPNIAMVLNFSSENTILNFQQTGRARASADKVKVPSNFASALGLDPDEEYSLKEIVEIIKGMNIGGGIEITEDLVASFLGLGPATSIDNQDMPFFEAVQKDYKDALKKAKIDYPEARAKGVKKGSFVAYCYFQLGVQVFSTDLWTVPEPKKEPAGDALTKEKLKEMTAEEFIALGVKKIEAFLKEQGAPPNFKAAMVINMVKSGKVTPKQMAEMMEKMPPRPAAGEDHPDTYIIEWSDSVLKGKGFVDWKPFKHPTLGNVEIGGFIPYLKATPPPSEIEKTVSFHADFYIGLMDRLPELEIKKTKVEVVDTDLYHVTVYFTNKGWFPTSTAQGRRARTSWPITVRLESIKDKSLFSGQPVVTLPFISGSGDTKKVEWTIRGKKGSKITITAKTPKLNPVTTTVTLQ